MAWVVFLRGVNVGGHKAFRPSAVARALRELDVVSVGAAGTFVVRQRVSRATLRAAMQRALPVATELMLCRAREVQDLHRDSPFARARATGTVTRYVTVLARRPRRSPPLPLRRPAGRDWQVHVIGVRGVFVLSLHRRRGRTLIYPNAVIERHFGAAATTRNWNTIGTICDMLIAGRRG